VTATTVDVALSKQVSVPANSTVSTSFYSRSRRRRLMSGRGRHRAGADRRYWQSVTTTDYANWLAAGKEVSSAISDTGLSTAYDGRCGHEADPESGTRTWPAATNPIAYGYKTWIRDSASRRSRSTRRASLGG